MHKVFISYHHGGDLPYKESLLELNRQFSLFLDASVDTGDIDENLDDARIREIIRDDYLRDSTVTIVLIGIETQRRKHVDWEIYSSMFDGAVNKKSGVLAIMLPTTGCTYFTARHSREKETVYPDTTHWTSVTDKGEYERRYPYMPARLIDNLMEPKAKISVTTWDRVSGRPFETCVPDRGDTWRQGGLQVRPLSAASESKFLISTPGFGLTICLASDNSASLFVPFGRLRSVFLSLGQLFVSQPTQCLALLKTKVWSLEFMYKKQLDAWLMVPQLGKTLTLLERGDGSVIFQAERATRKD